MSEAEPRPILPAEGLHKPDWPEYPLLHVSETDQQDKRELLPDEVVRSLRSDEVVVAVRDYPPCEWRADAPLNADEVVMLASGTDRADEIGWHGPPVASINPDKTEKSRYEYPHGRDALETARDVAWKHLDLLLATNHYLAEHQAVRDEPFVAGVPYGQEKPGSIILVDRGENDDPLTDKFAALKGWGNPNYFSADAPGAFILGLTDAQALVSETRNRNYLTEHRYTDRNGEAQPMIVALDLAARWLLDRTTDNPDGLIEYRNLVPGGGGLRNQGWRDSDDALVHADGSWANADSGIAALDVQAESYDAMRAAARLLRDIRGPNILSDELDVRALNLQRVVIERFVTSDAQGTYLASFTDRDEMGRLRRGEVVTSAIGRALESDLLFSTDPRLSKQCEELVPELIRRLMAPDMLTPWGIRTRSSLSSSYRPFGYHAGTVWSHDTGRVARGMSRHGYFGLDRLVGAGPTRLHQTTGLHLEFLSGDSTDTPKIPSRDTYIYNTTYGVLYLVEQHPPIAQTWSASKEIDKQRRYGMIPQRATDRQKAAFEAGVISQLQQSVPELVAYAGY